ncbi:thiamine/thiamine pyrophosphate ABC transporter permease ThiP [Zymobacter sp. IVIA_12111.31 C1]|uniref:thiamine/thiamine pyrophosphate ABC transporter permease ThiP n=1 Tax=Zymobacter sp. IVIA_12111.31 C1 TaxID=3394854 RepID=UPI0039C2E6C2
MMMRRGWRWQPIATLMALVVLLASLIGPLGALLVRYPPWPLEAVIGDEYLLGVVRFTVLQALLSMVLSIVPAIWVARALARRSAFFGRSWLLSLLGLPIVLPPIVAVFAITAVYGYNGVANHVLLALGLPRLGSVYGLIGILLGHVFFNLPLAVRWLLPLWERIPVEHWRLAAQLDMPSRTCFSVIEWPAIRGALPGLAALIFLLCLTSFAVVLTLGGGPAATTLPVALYQSLRMESDFPLTAQLALLQMVLCLIVLVILPWRASQATDEPERLQRVDRHDRYSVGARVSDGAALMAVTLFVGLPVLAALFEGLRGPWFQVLAQSAFWQVWWSSLWIALGSGALALLMGLPLSAGMAQHQARLRQWLQMGGLFGLAVPTVVLGAGWFILLRGNIGPWGSVLIMVSNGVMCVPYVLKMMVPAWSVLTAQYGPLRAQLGLSERLWWCRVLWPLSRTALGTALAVSLCMSLGDLGIVAIFGDQSSVVTLPLLLQNQMSDYQYGEAAVTSAALMLTIGALFALVDRLVGGRHVYVHTDVHKDVHKDRDDE